MSNPLALLPLAIAAGGGTLGAVGETAYEARALVAAGLTLLQRSATLVRALSGRRAAILVPTSPQFLVALAACDGRGAVLVNPLAAPAEVAFQCTDADVGAVFTVLALAARVPAGMPMVLLDEAPRTARLVASGEARDIDLGSHHGLALEGEAGVAGRDEEAAIVYTSAMRGRPLGAVLTHRNLLANARATIEAIAPRADDHVLALLPFAHLFGLTVTLSAPLIMGARVSTMDRFHPVRAADLLGGDVSVVVGVPAVFHGMLTGLARRGADLRGTALRLCICGGAVLPEALQDRWFAATGVELRQGYGLTEAAPVCLYNRSDRLNVRGSLGVPFPGVDVELRPLVQDRGAATGAVAEGTEGEICVRGANVFPGYLHDGEAGLVRDDDWLRTGDAGVKLPGGSVRFTRLLKAMFTRNGFNVYPRELELAVEAMPGVLVASVSPVPDAVKENDIRLCVTGDVSEAAVRAWCAERLSAYKQPSIIEITGPSHAE